MHLTTLKSGAMKKNFAFSFHPLFFLIPALLLFNACQKEESDTLTNNEEEQAALAIATAEADMEFAFNDVFDNVLGVNGELGIPGAGIFGRFTSRSGLEKTDSTACFSVSVSPLQTGVFPKTVTIDFGHGCSTMGHTRSGKITTVYTGRLILPGSSATTHFENYTIDDFSVSGSFKITNTATLSLQKQFTVEISDARLTRTDGSYILWSSVRTEKQVEGNATETHKDDIFIITGTGHGQVKTGNFIFLWNSKIVEPLMKKFICHWIVKGQVQTLRETLPASSQWQATLDYGNGNCDNKATVTVNGQSREISLH